MTSQEFKNARKKLSFSQQEMGVFLGYAGKNINRTVRRWESGESDIPPSVAQIIKWLDIGKINI